MNKHCLILKLQAITVFVNFLFQESDEDSGCAKKSGCYSITFREKKGTYTVKSNDKQLMTVLVINILHLCLHISFLLFTAAEVGQGAVK